jgi:hypothetical protein
MVAADPTEHHAIDRTRGNDLQLSGRSLTRAVTLTPPDGLDEPLSDAKASVHGVIFSSVSNGPAYGA